MQGRGMATLWFGFAETVTTGDTCSELCCVAFNVVAKDPSRMERGQGGTPGKCTNRSSESLVISLALLPP